jgi:hypothetical protein
VRHGASARGGGAPTWDSTPTGESLHTIPTPSRTHPSSDQGRRAKANTARNEGSSPPCCHCMVLIRRPPNCPAAPPAFPPELHLSCAACSLLMGEIPMQVGKSTIPSLPLPSSSLATREFHGMLH